METNSKFFEISQNNSGGSFITNDVLCHRLFIEADSYEEAILKAEGLGCYWNGVEGGCDCECCGDRWYQPHREIDLANMVTDKHGGYPVHNFIQKGDSIEKFKEDYKGMEWIDEPVMGEKYGSPIISGSIKLRNIEDYAQVLSNLFGWTEPETRIFYKDGSVKEISSSKYRKDED